MTSSQRPVRWSPPRKGISLTVGRQRLLDNEFCTFRQLQAAIWHLAHLRRDSKLYGVDYAQPAELDLFPSTRRGVGDSGPRNDTGFFPPFVISAEQRLRRGGANGWSESTSTPGRIRRLRRRRSDLSLQRSASGAKYLGVDTDAVQRKF